MEYTGRVYFTTASVVPLSISHLRIPNYLYLYTIL